MTWLFFPLWTWKWFSQILYILNPLREERVGGLSSQAGHSSCKYLLSWQGTGSLNLGLQSACCLAGFEGEMWSSHRTGILASGNRTGCSVSILGQGSASPRSGLQVVRKGWGRYCRYRDIYSEVWGERRCGFSAWKCSLLISLYQNLASGTWIVGNKCSGLGHLSVWHPRRMPLFLRVYFWAL